MNKNLDELKRLANGMTRSEIGQAFDELIESYDQLQSKLDKAIAALEFYTSRAVYERLQPDGDLIYCNEIAEQAIAEIRKKDE